MLPAPRLGDRTLFPALAARAYLAHAALSPPSAPLRASVDAHLDALATHGAGAFGGAVAQRERVRTKLASMINASVREIALVPNTSLGVTHVAMAFPWKPGDRVLLFKGEFPANVTPWQRAAALFGLDIAWVDADLARTDPERFLAAVDAVCAGGVRVVAVSAVQFQTGLRMPLRELSERAHRVGAALCVDGIQGLGAVPVDVERDGVDAYAAGGHKWLMGVEGAGMLYLRADLARTLRPHLAGWLSHDDAFGFLLRGPGLLSHDKGFRDDAGLVEGGTPSAAGYAALEASLDVLLGLGVANVYAHVNAYLDGLEAALVERGFRSLRGANAGQRSCILGTIPPTHDAPWWSKELADRGVMTSCPDGVLRFAPHWPNDLARELPAVCDAVDSAREESPSP